MTPLPRCVAACLLLAACSSTPSEPATIVLSTGEETDAWIRTPAVDRVEIRLTSRFGTDLVGASQAPTSSVEITNVLYVGGYGGFEALGLDVTGSPVLRGLSTPFFIDELRDFSIPLFVGRKGEWARPSDTLEQPRRKPLLSLVYQQYLFAAGGQAITGVDGSIPDVYDFGYWQIYKGQPRLARLPRSLAALDSLLLVIDDTGATWLDVSTDAATEAVAPAGLSFAEIAGGATVQAPDGSFFVVGATRTSGDATSKILKVGSDGKMETFTLATARLGAAASCVGLTGARLVVAGGSATGAGIEVLDQAQTLVPLAYPPDPTVGMAVAGIDDSNVLLLGGTDPATGATAALRSASLGCTQACATTAVAVDPLPLSQATAFRVADGTFLAVGENTQGETLAYEVIASPASTRALPLREPRKWASAAVLYTGQVAIVGGDLLADGSPARHIEVFTR
jgi:hypothetical protein